MSGTATEALRDLLATVRTIAIVGLSADPARPSNQVARFLLERGYECVGVNPCIDARPLHSIPIYDRLADIPHPVDMVDIFRASHLLGATVDEALSLEQMPRVIWMQLGLRDEQAKARAEASGLSSLWTRARRTCSASELSDGTIKVEDVD